MSDNDQELTSDEFIRFVRRCRWRRALAGACLFAGLLVWALSSLRGLDSTVRISAVDNLAAPAGESTSNEVIERGRYLAAAGNCSTCHTREGGAPFSGGVSFETPFGTIYSTNITPDLETGIGRWTLADLRRAMHEGIARGGSRLFPAFPYTSFTKVSNADVELIYEYLRTIKPVRYTSPRNSYLFSFRWPMVIWNSLFLKKGRYVRDGSQSEEWNRGRYLVDGLGHCSACHTPRDSFMREISDAQYEGGTMQSRVAKGKIRRWSAVSLTSAKHGLASWSVDDLTAYLSTGFSPRGGTFGPMNDVIVGSLRHLTVQDVRAMAVYLKTLPPRKNNGEGVPADLVSAGEQIYDAHCKKCHSKSGRGGMFTGPPLAGSAVVQTSDPASLINIILYGQDLPSEVTLGAWETMPSYADVLTDAEIASVSNFIRGSWGNRAPPVIAKTVQQQR